MRHIPRPEKNSNDPLPRPLQEKSPLAPECELEFWRLVFRNVGEAEMRVQSRFLYGNVAGRTDELDVAD